MNVLLLSRYDRNGASSRLRFLQYLPGLEQRGIHVNAMPLFDEAYLSLRYENNRRYIFSMMLAYLRRLRLLFTLRKYDLIWVQAEILPYFPATVERLLAQLGVPYVVDYDDAIFHKYDDSASWLIRRLYGEKISTVMRLANSVVAGNNYLAEKARAAGATSIAQIPTVVDYQRYDSHKKNYSMGTPYRHVIGWIGSPTTTQYIVDIAPALTKACQDNDAILRLIGADKTVRHKFPKGVDLELIEWSEEEEAQAISEFDVGIMPLKVNPWAKGKCGYKLIQYMAAGIPVIATETEANRDILHRGQSGKLVSPEDVFDGWVRSIGYILSNPKEADSMGATGRIAVKKYYSLQSQLSLISSCLQKAVEEPR